MKTSLKYIVLLFSINFIEGSFRCDYKYSLKAQAWFKFVVVPANWFDARLRCSEEGAVLASPTSPEILVEMRNLMNRSYPEFEIFTGIHATVSQGDYYTIEGTPLSKIAVPWSENEPDNKDNVESCIALNGNGELADRPCEVTRPYICYRPEASHVEVSECGTVDPEYHLDKRTNKCYKFHTMPRNFSRAYLACSAEGGHLAIINSDVEATVLRELFAKYPDAKFFGNFRKDLAFIGFQDWGEKWDLRTVHGQTLLEAGYNKFAPGEPNDWTPGEACGGIFRSGLLIDVWCNKPAPFFCEKSTGFPNVCKALF
uniref:IML29 n=1 Tax=Mythimna separata TaxID=271217 RepID=A0A8F3HKR7_MYTSE|nr:IML29 [Mythimna separata]